MRACDEPGRFVVWLEPGSSILGAIAGLRATEMPADAIVLDAAQFGIAAFRHALIREAEYPPAGTAGARQRRHLA